MAPPAGHLAARLVFSPFVCVSVALLLFLRRSLFPYIIIMAQEMNCMESGWLYLADRYGLSIGSGQDIAPDIEVFLMETQTLCI